MLTPTIFNDNAAKEHDEFVGRYPSAAQYMTLEHDIGDCWFDIALNLVRPLPFILPGIKPC